VDEQQTHTSVDQDQESVRTDEMPTEPAMTPAEPPDESLVEALTEPDDAELDAVDEEASSAEPVDAFREPASLVEAVLFTTDAPLPAARIAQVAQLPGVKIVRQAVKDLNEKYERMGCSFRVEEIGGGFRMMTQPEFHDVLGRLNKTRGDNKLSQAGLETLAILAYRQPILRADIEAIRGVASGEILRTLMEKQLVKIVGRAEVIGRPMLYGTTRRFLDVFGLASLEDLPRVEELNASRDAIKPKPAPMADESPAADPATDTQPVAVAEADEPFEQPEPPELDPQNDAPQGEYESDLPPQA